VCREKYTAVAEEAEPEPASRPNWLRVRMAFVIFGYYRILRVGLKSVGLSGVMAPNNQGQGQTQKANAPAPGAFSGGKTGASQGGAAVKLPRGRDWLVRAREVNGRTFYDLVARPGMRSTPQILKEALPEVHKWVTQHAKGPIMVRFTMIVGQKRQRNGRVIWPQVTLLIGSGGIAVQIPNPVVIGRIWDILLVAKEVNAKISPYDFSSGDSDDDSFNPPEDSSE